MKKVILSMLICGLLLAAACTGVCDSLFVDNRETDKVYPERLNLRAEPSKNGAILGLYYTGAEVEVLGVEEAFTKVSIGGVTGYMATEYLISEQAAEERYGHESGFGECRTAQVNLSGLWKAQLDLLAAADMQAERIASLEDGAVVALVGILGDEWAYIRADVDEEPLYGYVTLDALVDAMQYEAMIVAGSKADTRTMLYDAPNDRAGEIMTLKNGTACFSLFGRREGNWVKVRVGGVSGWIRYTQADNLTPLEQAQARSTVPYYPLMMKTKKEALLFKEAGEQSGAYMTLGQEMNLEVLAECGEYVYVRTLEGGAGAYDCGDYGYVAISDLSLAQSAGGVGIAQADDDDLPVLLYAQPEEGAAMVGALIAGAQVRISDFTQSDYLEVALGDMKAYALKAQIRALGDGSAEPSARIPQRAAALENLGLSRAPDAEAEIEVAKGERVYMLARCGDWAYVQADDQPGFEQETPQMGFVKISRLNAPASTLRLTAFVNKDKINIRSQADKSGEIVGRARLNERLRVADYGKEWSCIVTPDGKRGYVMTQYLEFE